MKKWTLFLAVYFCVCLLAACAAGGGEPVPGGMPSGEEQTGGETVRPAAVTTACHVVTEADGQLLLAGTGDGNVYALSLEGTDVTLDGKAIDLSEPGAYMDLPGQKLTGALVEVAFDGSVMETWPARFSGVTAVDIRSDGFDDLCALYLQVLEDLWEVDSGLNGGLTYIGVDLSRTRLSESERAAVAWAFAQNHGAELVTGTWEELAEQGFFTASLISTPAPKEGEAISKAWYQWTDGILFSITEKEEPVYFTPEGTAAVTFDAEKWRSGLGAYCFCDCTSIRDDGGHWDGYTVGSQAIS